MNRVILAATFSFWLIAIFAIAAISGAAESGAPPPELVQLEREVSLKMAHARDLGLTEPAKMKTLANAHQIDVEGEQALQAGDYQRAEQDFLKTKVMLRELGI